MTTTDTTPELTPMAVVANPPATAGAQPAVLPAERGLTLEHVAYLGVLLLSAIVHFWQLGERALHHDETLHGTYSWFIYVGQGYIHDPLLHGPLLYHLGALFFFLFGDNDFTARLGPAIFGTLLTVMPFLIRREIGRVAAFAASLYLLISPVFLYVGRFFRHDMYSIFFELLVIVAIVRFASSRRPLWIFVGVAAFALMYVNQETSYLYLLMIGTPLILLLLWRVYRPGVAIVGALGVALAALVFVLPGTAVVDAGHVAQRDPDTGAMIVEQAGPIFGWQPLETEDNSYALRIRNRPDNANGDLLTSFGGYLGDLWLFLRHPAILIGSGLVLAVIGVLVWQIWLFRTPQGTTRWQAALAADDPVIRGFHATRSYLLPALGVAFVIYALFFTAFLTNIIGVLSGTIGSLLYWLAQHNVERGGQPDYYYLLLLVIYEPLLVFWALAGAVMIGVAHVNRWRTRRSDPPPVANTDTDEAHRAPPPAAALPPHAPTALLPLLLLWWSITAIGIYSWAGEKMPWLLVHVALPLVLLGAWAFQQVWDWWQQHTPQDADPRMRWWAPLIFSGILIGVLAVGHIRFNALLTASDTSSGRWVTTLLLMVALTVILVIGSSLLRGWRWSVSMLALSLTLVFSFYTIRNSYRLNFLQGDVPTEVMIYTQTSPDVARVAERLEAVSQLHTNGLELPIIYDNETVWQWYLRDFTNADRSGPALSGIEPDVQAVLLLSENLSPENRQLLENEGFLIQRYPLRWWFPEGQMYGLYGDWQTAPADGLSLLGRVLRDPLNDATLADTWQFLVYRELDAPLGSSDFVIAVRPQIADLIGPGTGSSP